MKGLAIGSLVIALVALVGVGVLMRDIKALKSAADTPEEELELAVFMGEMQRFGHKLGLAIDATNQAAAGFYVHEVEEVLEGIIENVKEHDGFEISKLSKSMVLPLVETLEENVKAGDWPSVRENYKGLIGACNQCHVATEHAYIRIEPGWKIPSFNQSF